MWRTKHMLNDDGSVEDEFKAFGGILWLRGGSGWFAQQGSYYTDVAEPWDRSSVNKRITSPPRAVNCGPHRAPAASPTTGQSRPSTAASERACGPCVKPQKPAYEFDGNIHAAVLNPMIEQRTKGVAPSSCNATNCQTATPMTPAAPAPAVTRATRTGAAPRLQLRAGESPLEAARRMQRERQAQQV